MKSLSAYCRNVIFDTSAESAPGVGIDEGDVVIAMVVGGTGVGISEGVPEGGGWVTRTVVFTGCCVGVCVAGTDGEPVHPAVMTTAQRRAKQR